MPRGGWRGGGRPTKPDNERRTHLGCRVRPENKVWLYTVRDRTHQSVGELVDLAIQALKDTQLGIHSKINEENE